LRPHERCGKEGFRPGRARQGFTQAVELQMKKVRLNWKRYAKVDDEDFEKCAGIRWHIKKYAKYRNGHKVHFECVYANVTVNGVQAHLALARHILGARPHQRVTYVNGNHLDCQKKNLKLAGMVQLHEPLRNRAMKQDFAFLDEALAHAD
jgi:hypothetical protein